MPWSWSWTPHPLTFTLVVAAAAAYAWAIRRLGPLYAPPGGAVSRAQVWAFACGVAAFGIALSWPVDDLARATSASAHAVEQLLLVLAVPPLVLLGLPRWLLALWTESPRVERVLRAVTRPTAAFVAFNAVLVVAWLPAVVQAEARWGPVSDVVHAALIVVGFMMWIPALRVVPGARPLPAASRIAYLFAQSVVFELPTVLLVFAGRPVYDLYADHVRAALGIGPLADQRLAGGIAKVAGLAVLLLAAALILHHGRRAEEAGEDPEPLLWDDVERELRRLERRSKGTTDAG